MDRKQLKKNARTTLGSHWGLLVIITAIVLAAETAAPGNMNQFLAGIVRGIQHGQSLSETFTSYFSSVSLADEVVKWVIIIMFGIFFLRVLRIVADRLFLEARTYEKVPVQHVFYLTSVKKWTHTALAHFRKCLYLFLWSLTVIGGVIKYYSYFLTEYILAENPSVSGKEAIALSRKMMNGHKMEAFLLQLSLLPWFLLAVVTLGIAGVLYVNPYVSAVYSEYYAYLRNEAKKNGIEGTEALNDSYLFEKADDDVLQKAYKDLRLDQRYVAMNEVKLNGLQSFLVNVFGLWIGSEKKRRLYQGTEDIRLQTVMNQNAVEKKQYPFRLSPLYERRNAHYEGQMNEKRAYTIWTYMLFFVLAAFLGWTMEFTGLLETGAPSSLKGPWMLSAGLIGCLSLFALGSLRKSPVASYIGTAIISALVLYLTKAGFSDLSVYGNGVALCINSLACGLAAVVFLYGIAPYIDGQITISRKATVVTWIAVILFVLFIVDCVTASSGNVADVLLRMLA